VITVQSKIRRLQRIALPAIAAVTVLAAFSAASGSPSSQWKPASTDRFQIMLSSRPSVSQMKGAFSVMEFDGTEATTAQVTSLHALSKKAVCYIDVGTWEKWRPDAKSFPTSVLGKPDAGWPGERWLDIRRTSVLLPIMKKRIDMCAAKGFDAVDPDNVNGFENPSGFPLTRAEQYSYDRAIAALAHADHLAVALKSFASGAKDLQPHFDFVVDEQCATYQECMSFSSFVTNDKPVFDIEYTGTTKFCASLPPGVFGIAKRLSLNAWTLRCPKK
jgi:hypothetical protein